MGKKYDSAESYVLSTLETLEAKNAVANDLLERANNKIKRTDRLLETIWNKCRMTGTKGDHTITICAWQETEPKVFDAIVELFGIDMSEYDEEEEA